MVCPREFEGQMCVSPLEQAKDLVKTVAVVRKAVKATLPNNKERNRNARNRNLHKVIRSPLQFF